MFNLHLIIQLRCFIIIQTRSVIVCGGAWLLKSTNQTLSCAKQVDRRTTICYQGRLQTQRLQQFHLQHNNTNNICNLIKLLHERLKVLRESRSFPSSETHGFNREGDGKETENKKNEEKAGEGEGNFSLPFSFPPPTPLKP